MKKFLKISEVSVILGLVNRINKKPLNYILRYWEKEFYQIKPLKINKKRYYSPEQIKILKMIKFLMKGVKKMLNKNINRLDENNFHSLKKQFYKDNLKKNTKKLLEKIKNLKNYGKKNSS